MKKLNAADMILPRLRSSPGELQGVVVSDGLDRRVAVDRVSPSAVERFVKVKRRAYSGGLSRTGIQVDML